MADTAKHGVRSKTVWMSVLQIVSGLAAIAGLVGPVLGEQAAGWMLVIAGVAHVILRTITGEPIRWGTRERPPTLLLATIVGGALMAPLAVTAQEVAVDTVTITIEGRLVTVAITHAPVQSRYFVGDTLHFTMDGTDEFGDPFAVAGEFFSTDPLTLEIIEQLGDSAVAVTRDTGTVAVSARNFYTPADSLIIGAGPIDVLTPTFADLSWDGETRFTAVGQQIQLCAYGVNEWGYVFKSIDRCPDPPDGYVYPAVNPLYNPHESYYALPRVAWLPPVPLRAPAMAVRPLPIRRDALRMLLDRYRSG